jgi:hypothetical protein
MLWEFHIVWSVLKVKQPDTAFPNRGNYGNIMICPTWDNEKDDEVERIWAGGRLGESWRG